MASSNGNIFRVSGSICGEFTGHRTNANDAELWCFLCSAPELTVELNNRETGDLRRHRTNYDVSVTMLIYTDFVFTNIMFQHEYQFPMIMRFS